MGRTLFRRKGVIEALRIDQNRISRLELETKLATGATTSTANTALAQTLTFMFQSTQFTKSTDTGEIKINNTTTPTSAIDEETLASVAAYATFDDIGGNGASSADVLGDATTRRVPLFDNESKVGYYRGDPAYLAWDNDGTIHPSVTHTRQFLAGHSVKLNVPGTATQDKKAFVYYDSNAAFNISASISASLWFYPTDLTQIASETYRYLLYRYIDASNSFVIAHKPADNKIYVFTNEAAATTKLASSATVTANQWHNIIFTYNPSTNALVMYLDNSSSSTTPADALPNPYTTNSNMYSGGLPTFPDKRFTGYLDNFVFWTGKILTGTEVTNMWTHGTIV